VGDQTNKTAVRLPEVFQQMQTVGLTQRVVHGRLFGICGVKPTVCGSQPFLFRKSDAAVYRPRRVQMQFKIFFILPFERVELVYLTL